MVKHNSKSQRRQQFKYGGSSWKAENKDNLEYGVIRVYRTNKETKIG
jgi:hypothetical protein